MFRRRFKRTILFSLTMCLLATVWFTLLVTDALPKTSALLIICVTLQGVFKDATAPLFYELSAELIYPRKEAASAGLLVLMLNMSAGVTIGLDGVLSGENMNYVMIAVLAAVILLVWAGVKEEYKRPSSLT